MNEFGQEIKRLRTASKLTQIELAEKIGITQGAVASLESGRKGGVSVETLYALSDALGVESDHWRQFLKPEPSPKQKPPPAPGKRGRK